MKYNIASGVRMDWCQYTHRDPATSARQREGRPVRDDSGGIEIVDGDGE